MKNKDPNNPEFDKNKQLKRRRVADLSGSAVLATSSYFSFKYCQSLEPLTWNKEVSAFSTIFCASVSVAFLGSFFDSFKRDDGNEGGWGEGFDDTDPVEPPNGPGGIGKEFSDLIVEDILKVPQIFEEKVLINT